MGTARTKGGPLKPVMTTNEKVGPQDAGWSDWITLDPELRLAGRVLQELLEGGQSFQWDRVEPPVEPGAEQCAEGRSWVGVLDQRLLRLRIAADGDVQFCVWQTEDLNPVRESLRRFFRLREDLAAYLETFPLATDSYLRRCIQTFPGLRILCQPIEKVALTFLCSSNKQIPQIKQMLQHLSRELGVQVAPGWWEYPSWAALADAALPLLQACRTGYRSKYIQGCARLIAEDPTLFARLREMPCGDARIELMKLPGVGAKVADCILLYGAGHYAAFPLDTWILKSLEHRYGRATPNRTALLEWVSAHFGAYAGIAQQFIFAYEREVRELTQRAKA